MYVASAFSQNVGDDDDAISFITDRVYTVHTSQLIISDTETKIRRPESMGTYCDNDCLPEIIDIQGDQAMQSIL